MNWYDIAGLRLRYSENLLSSSALLRKSQWSKEQDLVQQKGIYEYTENLYSETVINISQGKASTRVRCDGIFSDHFIANLVGCGSEKIAKIAQCGCDKTLLAYFFNHSMYTLDKRVVNYWFASAQL